MHASNTLSDLNDLVDQVDDAPDGKRVVAHPAWGPFIEAMDTINSAIGQLNGRANELAAEQFSASEEKHDRAKQPRKATPKRR